MSATACVGIEAVAIDRAGTGSRHLRAAARPSTSPDFACSAERKRSFHEVAASASARFELGKIGRRAVRRVELQRVERLGERLTRSLPEPVIEVTSPCQAFAGCRANRSLSAAVEALARREHQAGREPADRVAAREQRHAAALLELQDAERMVVERVSSIWNSSSRG